MNFKLQLVKLTQTVAHALHNCGITVSLISYLCRRSISSIYNGAYIAYPSSSLIIGSFIFSELMYTYITAPICDRLMNGPMKNTKHINVHCSVEVQTSKGSSETLCKDEAVACKNEDDNIPVDIENGSSSSVVETPVLQVMVRSVSNTDNNNSESPIKITTHVDRLSPIDDEHHDFVICDDEHKGIASGITHRKSSGSGYKIIDYLSSFKG
jgi:hypothetical protein